MAEWLVEQGIGEDRAILFDKGHVLAARIQRHGRLLAGTVADARLIARASGARRGTLLFASGEEALIDGLPADAKEGATIRAQIVRAAMAETGRFKRAQARPANGPEKSAPSLAEALRATGATVRLTRRFADDPWPEIVGEALEGHVAFAGGSLTISPTPAMTLIDVDGTLPPAALALAALPAVAGAIRRLDLAGSIGVDLPTLERRDDRKAVDEALARLLESWPHQRTAINGFGFVQLVSRLQHPSILSNVRGAPAVAGAQLLMRRIEDVAEPGGLQAYGHPSVVAAISPEWRQELLARTGRGIDWIADPALTLLGGFAQAAAS